MTDTLARDEMVDGQGGVRPHWRPLLGVLTTLGPEGLRQLDQRLERAFEDEGITAVLPGTSVQDHPWRCDPVPLPLPEQEFRALAAGLAQRARLLQAVLTDLSGDRQLLASGLLPPALVYANPSFLRIAALPRGVRMSAYAADLVRGPDGTWRVLADRTQPGAGIGYTLENRRILARVAPQAFRAAPVHALRPFFDLWQDILRRLAGADGAMAVLTPGPRHSGWFEHMYLARELGCALVEGGDLTVRDRKLYLKTLRGLQRIAVLMRRVEGAQLDPLELETTSPSGVPGLIDAARAGNLHIVNDPGVSVVDAPAFVAVLPRLAQAVLGEELLLPSVPTLWLGEADALACVRAQPADWWLRLGLDPNAAVRDPASLSANERQALNSRIAERPWEWVAQAPGPVSLAPTLVAADLLPRPTILRLFLVFDGARWHAMPGGLARILDDPGHIPGQLPRGGLTKDVWVMAEEEGADIVGPAALVAPPMPLRRVAGDLPSRAADNLYWLGRHVERVERAARLVRAAGSRLTRGSAMLPREMTDLRALGQCLSDAGVIPPETVGALDPDTLANMLRAAAGPQGTFSTQFDVIAELTESVRDRLTWDMHATFTQALRTARSDTLAAAPGLEGLVHGMVSILRFSTAVAGVAAENMVRGGGFIFLDLGRRIERARAITGEIGFALNLPPERIETGLRLILELCDSVITYRARYQDVLQPAPVLDLVLADQGNPRGLAFQLAAMHTLLDALTGESGGREMLAGAAAGLLAEAEALVSFMLAARDQAEAASSVPQRLIGITNGLAALSDQITRRYFALLPAAQLVGLRRGARPIRGAA